MNRAYSTFDIKSLDDDQRTFEGIASTPTLDLGDDVMEPFGAQFQLPMPLLWQHGKQNIKDPVGEIFWAKPTKEGIPVKGRFAKVDAPPSLKEDLDRAWVLVKSRLVRGLSIGWRPIESEPLDRKNPYGAIRHTKWGWFELSAVTIPMNQEASIHIIKSIDDAYLRAASGIAGKDGRAIGTSTPGATGSSQGKTMKSIEQRINELESQRASSVVRMKELMDGSDGDIASLGEDEVKEYDGLLGNVKNLDTDLRRLRGHQAAVSGAIEVGNDAGTDQEKGLRARRGIPREPKQKFEKGIALAQYLKLLGRAKGNPMHAYEMAKSSQAVDERVPVMLKAAVEGASVSGTTTAGNWGMELVGTETGVFADFVEFLRPQTILGKFGTGGIPALRRVPFRVPLIGMTTGGSGYWVGEGKAKPLTKATFSRTHLDPLKVAAIMVATKELLADSSPSADMLLRDELVAALRERTDVDFIDPAKTAEAGISPASITKDVTPIPSSGTDAGAVRADILAIFNSFISASNPPTSGVWIMSSQIALALSLMRNALGNPEFPGIGMTGGTFEGLPVITSEYVPVVTGGAYVVLVNASDIYFGDDGGFTVDTSEHASLQMDDGTSTDGMHDSTTPTPVQLVSMYQTNSVAFRAERRLDWMRRRDSAVAVLSGVAWAAGT